MPTYRLTIKVMPEQLHPVLYAQEEITRRLPLVPPNVYRTVHVGEHEVTIDVESDGDLTGPLNEWFTDAAQRDVIPGYGYPHGSLLLWSQLDPPGKARRQPSDAHARKGGGQ